MNITDSAILGLASSVVTEILKFIPFLRTSSLGQAVTAIVVVAAVSFIGNGGKLTLESVASTLVFALVSYKAIVEPAAESAGLSSQG